MPPLHFVVFILVSLAVFIGNLRWALRSRPVAPSVSLTSVVALIAVVVGMCFAKWGANAGLTSPIYYGIPALIALVFPPLVLRMRRGELAWYLALTFASSPAIHAIFSFVVGWHEYLPFWRIPSFWDQGNAGA